MFLFCCSSKAATTRNEFSDMAINSAAESMSREASPLLDLEGISAITIDFSSQSNSLEQRIISIDGKIFNCFELQGEEALTLGKVKIFPEERAFVAVLLNINKIWGRIREDISQLQIVAGMLKLQTGLYLNTLPLDTLPACKVYQNMIKAAYQKNLALVPALIVENSLSIPGMEIAAKEAFQELSGGVCDQYLPSKLCKIVFEYFQLDIEDFAANCKLTEDEIKARPLLPRVLINKELYRLFAEKLGITREDISARIKEYNATLHRDARREHAQELSLSRKQGSSHKISWYTEAQIDKAIELELDRQLDLYKSNSQEEIQDSNYVEENNQ